MKLKALFKVALCCLAALMPMTSSAAFAQVLYGTMVGTITDPDGRILASVSVTATNASTGTSISGKTDESGSYAFHNLAPCAFG
ncbi:MAG: Carboxypeptidase regulatory-like domain [Acidobacteriaceae bacterium]|nr:Carboxypeptidase regulatory-like domain [Acidobacteriaceae bacterium]